MSRPQDSQTTSRLLLIRPAAFGFNPETAASNRYQRTTEASEAEVRDLARREFDALAQALVDAGLAPVVVEDTPTPRTPDAVFPNNWVSFHADGTAIVYPMLAPTRRLEVRPDLFTILEQAHGLRWPHRVDLTPLAERGAFLEGTGSLVLDRAQRLAYAALSPRTTEEGIARFCAATGYEPVVFRAQDQGVAIYHTNVLMGIGPRFAAVCLEAVGDPNERESLAERLRVTDHEVVALSFEQMNRFAGNLLAAETTGGDSCIVLSAAARASLTPEQRRTLERHGELVSAPLTTIEALGGGSARCMLAELHAPEPSALHEQTTTLS